MLETQQINQAIADALTALGLAEELAWEDDELMCSEGHFTSMTQWHRRVGDMRKANGIMPKRWLRR